jgi:uncharacterized C2H2 Zn-finger protein
MKLSWKQIRVFGITFTLPQIIILVQQLNAEQVEQFRQYKAGMAECPKCHKLFSGRAGNSFILHLQDEHRFESDKSMRIVEDLYKNLLVIRARRTEVAQTAAAELI